MIRYSLFLLAVLATGATAIAAINPAADATATASRNVTVIEKNQAFPVIGPIVVETCAVEDCSDVRT